MRHPRIAEMDAIGLPFHLAKEEGRTREDARINALCAMEVLNAIADAARTRGTRIERHDDPLLPKTWRMEMPHDGHAILQGHEGVVRLVAGRGDTTLLTCSVGAGWRKPTRRDFATAADLFLLAAQGAAEPGPGDVAYDRMLGHAARNLSNGYVCCTIGAALPWRKGTMSGDVRGDDRTWYTSMEWDRVQAAEVTCSYTHSGITLSIGTPVVDLRRDDLDPMEMMRLIAGLGDDA